MRATLSSVGRHDCPSQCALQVEDTGAGVAVVEGHLWSKHQTGGRGVSALTDDRTADTGAADPRCSPNLAQIERLG